MYVEMQHVDVLPHLFRKKSVIRVKEKNQKI